MLFLDPLPDLKEAYPPNYYSFNYRQASWIFRLKRRLDRVFLKRWSRGVRSALDVGGGAGWLLTTLREVNPAIQHTWVVDLDDAAASQARAAGHSFFQGRIEDFQSEQRFDLILMLNLIEHVADPLAVLAQAGRLLAPGGRILLQTPNIDCWDARFFRHRNWAGFHTPRHWVLFSPESFLALAARAGLKAERWWFTQAASFWASTLLAKFSTRERSTHQHPLFGMLTPFFAALDLVRLKVLRQRTGQMFFVLRPAEPEREVVAGHGNALEQG